VLLHKSADAGLAATGAEVTANLDAGEVLGDFAQQDGALGGHRWVIPEEKQAHLSR
jgi:hypothetical protein